MSTTYSQSLGELFTLINTIWNSGTTAIVGYIPTLIWMDNDIGVVPDASKFYARVSVTTMDSFQSSLSTEVCGSGKRRFTTKGVLFVEIFSPKGYPPGSTKTRLLAELLLPSLRGKTTNNWFRNATIKELSPESGCARNLVSVEYEFDEIA